MTQILVKDFMLVPHVDGTFFLQLNGTRAAEYFYDLSAVYRSLIQIDVCSHCFYPGCSDYGYTEVIDLSTYVAWKEPSGSKLSYSNRDFNPALILTKDTVYWTKEKYEEFVSVVNELQRNTSNCYGISAKMADVIDLWRLEGSRVCHAGGCHTSDLHTIYEKSIGFYSEALTEEQCEQLFWNASEAAGGDHIEAVPINPAMKPIVMMFDMPIYTEWNCLYLLNEEIYYSIGDGLVLKI